MQPIPVPFGFRHEPPPGRRLWRRVPLLLDHHHDLRSVGGAQLRAVPEVIAVAGGAAKAGAVHAVIAGGYAKSLVVDATLATALLTSRGERVD